MYVTLVLRGTRGERDSRLVQQSPFVPKEELFSLLQAKVNEVLSGWNRRQHDDIEGDILNPEERGHHFEGTLGFVIFN